MIQRQADTKNTKSYIPPVWKTVGMNRGVQKLNACKYSRELINVQVLLRGLKKMILHRALKKKTKSKKNPIEKGGGNLQKIRPKKLDGKIPHKEQ